MQLNVTILLLGLKHSGKSSVGQALATRLGCPCIDVDLLCVQEHAQRGGKEATPAAIYRAHGMHYWQELEQGAAGRVAAQRQRAVVALGGGMMDNRAAMDVLDGVGMCVYLQADCQVLYDRFMSTEVPAFLEQTATMSATDAAPQAPLHERWLRLCARRATLCGHYADMTIATAERSIEELSAQVYAQLAEVDAHAG